MGWFRRDREPRPEVLASGSGSTGAFDLALAEARRGFDEQAAQFGKIRANVGAFLGYGGVAFSVLVVTPGPSASTIAGWLLMGAVVGFCVMALTVAYVMSPVSLVPGANPCELVGWADAGDEPDSMARDLALHYETAYQANNEKLRRRTTAGTVCLVVFATTIVLLTLRVAGM